MGGSTNIYTYLNSAYANLEGDSYIPYLKCMPFVFLLLLHTVDNEEFVDLNIKHSVCVEVDAGWLYPLSPLHRYAFLCNNDAIKCMR